MHSFIFIVLLFVVLGLGFAGFALGWFNFTTSTNEGKRDLKLTIDPDKVKKDRDAVFGWFPSSTPPTDKKTDKKTEPAAADAGRGTLSTCALRGPDGLAPDGVRRDRRLGRPGSRRDAVHR